MLPIAAALGNDGLALLVGRGERGWAAALPVRSLRRWHGIRAARSPRGATLYLQQGPGEMTPFDLSTGEGICVPHSFPHVVRNGRKPSISLFDHL